jgi:uncharacterized RDD family membrane protein YckC/DNA-binding transcriptional ArsR family regulator
MAVDQENVSKVFTVLSHPLRRQILLYLSKKQEGSFTDLATAFKVDTGKLSFHLRSLEAFLEQTPNGKYKLSRVGQNTIVLIKDLETWSTQAHIARKPFIRPLASADKRVIAFLIDLAIAFVLFLVLPNVMGTFTLQFTLLNISIIFFLILFWVYLTLLEGFSGQTLGKLLVRIKVLLTSGEDASYDHAAVRNFGKVFLLPFDLAFGLRLKDERFIRFFDKFAGTTVIDLEPSVPHVNTSQQQDEGKPNFTKLT